MQHLAYMKKTLVIDLTAYLLLAYINTGYIHIMLQYLYIVPTYGAVIMGHIQGPAGSDLLNLYDVFTTVYTKVGANAYRSLNKFTKQVTLSFL